MQPSICLSVCPSDPPMQASNLKMKKVQKNEYWCEFFPEQECIVCEILVQRLGLGLELCRSRWTVGQYAVRCRGWLLSNKNVGQNQQ